MVAQCCAEGGLPKGVGIKPTCNPPLLAALVSTAMHPFPGRYPTLHRPFRIPLPTWACALLFLPACSLLLLLVVEPWVVVSSRWPPDAHHALLMTFDCRRVASIPSAFPHHTSRCSLASPAWP